MKIRYFQRQHSGGLKESLATQKYISKSKFEDIVKNYDYYAFDERVNQILFIRKEMEKHIDEPTWIGIEIHEDKDIFDYILDEF